LHQYEIFAFTLTEIHTLTADENRILRMCDPKKQEGTPGWRSSEIKELNSYPGTVS